MAEIVEARPGELVLRAVPGRHGQDQVELGQGHGVLLALGMLLCEIQAIEPTFYGEYQGEGVLLHGDFGPNNVLLSDRDDSVTLIADWEWSTVGSPLADLAWAELIVRLHHPEHQDCLTALVRGLRPSSAMA